MALKAAGAAALAEVRAEANTTRRTANAAMREMDCMMVKRKNSTAGQLCIWPRLNAAFHMPCPQCARWPLCDCHAPPVSQLSFYPHRRCSCPTQHRIETPSSRPSSATSRLHDYPNANAAGALAWREGETVVRCGGCSSGGGLRATRERRRRCARGCVIHHRTEPKKG